MLAYRYSTTQSHLTIISVVYINDSIIFSNKFTPCNQVTYNGQPCIQFLIIFERRVVYLTIIARAFESIQANHPLVYNNKRTLRYHTNPSSSFHQCWSDYDNNYNNYNNNKWDIPQTDFPEATAVAASGFACVNTWIIIICKFDFEAVINKWLEGIASRANGCSPSDKCPALRIWIGCVSTRQSSRANGFYQIFPFHYFDIFALKKTWCGVVVNIILNTNLI